jgi:hypothetical protein
MFQVDFNFICGISTSKLVQCATWSPTSQWYSTYKKSIQSTTPNDDRLFKFFIFFVVLYYSHANMFFHPYMYCQNSNVLTKPFAIFNVCKTFSTQESTSED